MAFAGGLCYIKPNPMKSSKMKYLTTLAWIIFATLARLMPHLANLSPFNSLIMVVGSQYSRRASILMTLAILLISDVSLALLKGYPILGFWTLFTYSGFALIAASAHWLKPVRSLLMICGYGVCMTTIYWLWTNFGTWLGGQLYAHSLPGLAMCYINALPFLERSLLSVLIFLPIGMAALELIRKRQSQASV